MNFKENKGITGVDLSVALIIVVLFVGLIVTLTYNFSASSQEVNRKSQAINIAIQKVEELKGKPYDEITSGESTEYRDKNGQTINGNSGAYEVKTLVTKYSDSEYVPVGEKEKISDVIKIVNITVRYTVQSKEQKVEISTVIAKGD